MSSISPSDEPPPLGGGNGSTLGPPKKKKESILPPPPEIDLDAFESQFTNHSSSKSRSQKTKESASVTNVSSSAVVVNNTPTTPASTSTPAPTIVIPPPPPPAPPAPQMAPTTAIIPPNIPPTTVSSLPPAGVATQAISTPSSSNDVASNTNDAKSNSTTTISTTSKSDASLNTTPSPPPPPPPPIKVIGGGTPHPPSMTQSIRPKQQQRPSPPLLTAQPLSLVSSFQTSFPILLVPTHSSSKITKKNNLSLSEMFTGLGNTLYRDLSVTNRLPPFRSVNKSLVLSWENLSVRFMERDDFEKELGEWEKEVMDGTKSRDMDAEDEIWKQRAGNDGRKCHMMVEELEKMLSELALSEDDDDDDDDGKKEEKQGSELSSSGSSSSSSKKGINVAISMMSRPSYPWMRRYRTLLDTFVQGTNVTDMTSCPIVTLFIASSSEDYINCLRELNNIHHLPRPYQMNQFDPNGMRRQYLVLHDDSTGAKIDEQEVILRMKEAFPNQACAVLRINSGDNEEEDESIWRDYRLFSTPIATTEKIGLQLSPRDKLAIRRFVATLIADGALPALERRIFHLNSVVNNAKRGVKNMFKSMWRKPKDMAPNSGNSSFDTSSSHNNTKSPPPSGFAEVKYQHDTIESQIRLLGDSLFLIRDFENALSMFRLVKDDYKSDKSTLHYANVQEKIALCYHLLDSTRYSRELQNAIESALYSYTRLAPNPNEKTTPWTKYATRLCLILSSYPPLASFNHSDIADLLASTSSHETPLGAAILLERAAYHYSEAGMYRKFAFHALMAGHMYRSARQEEHGMRCFISSLCVYRGMKWGDLIQHLDSALAAQLYALNRLAVCVVLYCVLLKEKSVKGGVRSQGRFIQHLMDVCRRNPQEGINAVKIMKGNVGDVLEISNLDLPRVWKEKVVLEGEEEWRYGPEMNVTIDDEDEDEKRLLWKEMTCEMEAELSAVPQNDIKLVLNKLQSEKRELVRLTNAMKKHPQKSDSYPNYGPALRSRMEPIRISFTAINPLAVQLQFTQMQLVAVLENVTSQQVGTSEPPIVESKKEQQQQQQHQKIWTFLSLEKIDFEVPSFYRISNREGLATTDEPFFVVDKQAMVIEPNSALKVTLSLTPLVKGHLKIVGYRSKLFNEIWVYHQFQTKGPLLQDTAIHRANRVRGESYLLQSKIQSEMPKLEIDLLHAPSFLLQGQISKWTLLLKNKGTAPACNILLKTNLPWVTFDTPDKESRYHAATSHCVGPSGTLLKLPLPNLSPGETMELPIYIRACGGGRREFYFLFRYEFFTPEEKARVRFVRKYATLAIYPSLTLTASLMPSYWSKTEHILSIEVTNYRSDRNSQLNIRLNNITIASRHYQAISLSGQLGDDLGGTGNSNKALEIGWQERITMHYLIVPLDDKEKVGCTLSECGLVKGKEGPAVTTRVWLDFLCLSFANENFEKAVLAKKEELARLASQENDSTAQPRSIAQIRRANTELSQTSGATSTPIASPPPSGNALPHKSISSPSLTALVDDLMYHPTSIANLCPPQPEHSHIHVICAWKALLGGEGKEDDEISGQHSLVGLVVRPKEKIKGCPLTITAKHETDIVHNFHQGPLTMDLDITIRNRLIEQTTPFEFFLERQPEYEFIGPQRFECELEGGGELQIPLRVAIPRSGIYNLQSVRLTVRTDGMMVPYLFPLQWIVKVENDNI